MGTVGEMVTERMMMQARQGGSGGTTGPEQTLGRMFIAPQQALRSLGIWDAEVLEGQMQTDGWYDEIHLDNDSSGVFEYRTGQRVRVIVLKGEE